jgi:polyribonucleotide nucleotidyltransferase
MSLTVDMEVDGRRLTIESGKLAKQANGSALVKMGETVVLVTTTAKEANNGDLDNFPLMVDWRDRFYAAGRFPGGFFKREGAPKSSEILSARLIDRSLRPLFDKELQCDLYIYTTVLSIDDENDPDILGIIGASSALFLSDIPFEKGPIAGVRIGKIGERLILNPTYKEREKSKMDLIVAGSKSLITMIEAGANEASEEEILEAIELAQETINSIISLQEKMAERRSVEKIAFPKRQSKEGEEKLREFAYDRMREAVAIEDQKEREEAISSLYNEAEEALGEEISVKDIRVFLDKIKREAIRKEIIATGRRPDGRGPKDIREITCETEVLKRTHGSAIFTRGGTCAMVVTTLGTAEDEQLIDEIEGKWNKRFLLHYNFPPWSTGEAKPLKAPGRREIGHGALAERALEPIIPSEERFPYTIRVVSEILESNGSTSMASVCGGTLSLMDAGVPIKAPVAGIAMGLIKEGKDAVILSDITGGEDHIGDMDFKVAGTEEGITALQMDIKIEGLDADLMRKALFQAREGRLYILEKMRETISRPRRNVSRYAPKVFIIEIKKDRIKDLIGPGGSSIRNIIETTGAKIDIDDSGKVKVSHVDEKCAAQALEMVKYLTEEVEEGKIYKGKVTRVVSFGAFVEILPGQEGLLHISEIAPYRIERIEDFIKEGDEVRVKVISIDPHGRINLSKKDVDKNRSFRRETVRRRYERRIP